MNRQSKTAYGSSIPLRALPIHISLAIFAGAGLLLYLVTHWLIPYLSQRTGGEPVLFWFLCAGLLVFLPMLFTARFILRREGHWGMAGIWTERLRFKKLTSTDWRYIIAATIVIGVLGFLIMTLIESYFGPQRTQPAFMQFDPLTPGRYWILAAWLPFWLLNIMGEEILWRGVLLPRQEGSHGQFAWLFHAIGWLIFHLPFGGALIVTMLPILFIEPYIVQKTKNSWTGVIIHAVVNGPAFIAIAFGLL
jgi:membrane protease YdiL (CAAX protease family)